MAILTLRDKVKLEIEKIKRDVTDSSLMKDTKSGRFYVLEKTDYSFKLAFVYNAGVFKSDTVDILEYSLKDRLYKLERNFSEVAFNEDNLSRSFCKMSAKEAADLLEVDGNKGFYEATREFGCRDRERDAFISRQLIRLIEDYPAMEMIYKAGLWNSKFTSKWNYNTLSKVDAKANTLLGFYKFKYKLQLKLYREAISLESRLETDNNYYSRRDFSGLFFMYLQQLELDDLVIVRDLIDWCKEFYKKYGILKFQEISDFYGFLTLYDCSERLHRYDNLIKDRKRFVEYAFYELDVRQACLRTSTYIDYLTMASEMGSKYDKYPSSLLLSHAITARFYNLLHSSNDTGLKEKFNAAVAALKVYEEEILGTGYSIVVPTEMEDIIQEGIKLSHCVKSYIVPIANGVKQIVFLRYTILPDEPLYTIEIADGAVVQAAGFDNCDLPEKAGEALDKFCEDFNLESKWRQI